MSKTVRFTCNLPEPIAQEIRRLKAPRDALVIMGLEEWKRKLAASEKVVE